MSFTVDIEKDLYDEVYKYVKEIKVVTQMCVDTKNHFIWLKFPSVIAKNLLPFFAKLGFWVRDQIVTNQQAGKYIVAVILRLTILHSLQQKQITYFQTEHHQHLPPICIRICL